MLNHVPLCATPWTVALQAPVSMGFSRQEYWNGLPLPSSGDLPDPGIKPLSPALQADSLPLSHLGSPQKLLWSLENQEHTYIHTHTHTHTEKKRKRDVCEGGRERGYNYSII